MKNLAFIGFCFLLFSCQKKEVLLPQISETIVADVKDHSPIYMFFEIKGNDTLVDVNRKNSISSTNWLFNIDKRLPLKLVIPEIQKLQAKKENSSHKSENSENYFTYMDSQKKTLAFVPFTEAVYTMQEPTFGVVVYFDAKSVLYVNNEIVKEEELQSYLDKIESDEPIKFQFCFSKNQSFEAYLKNRIFFKKIKFEIPILQTSSIEYIF